LNEKYLPLKDVAEKLGVARGTLFYYMERLKIEPVKFPLDKRKYILEADYERIRTLRQEAAERSKDAA